MTASLLAVVGCGAIAEKFHLPALARHRETMRRTVLVDLDRRRAAALAERFGAAASAASLEELAVLPAGVVVLTPARSHHALTLCSLEAGAHVLCEKPLAERAGQVDEIVAAARERRRHVAVNNARRLIPAFKAARDCVAAGTIGRLQAVEMSMGEPFNWHTATNAYFGAGVGGRGVLADIGAHILDLGAWWLDSPLELIDYQDDSSGGTEAVADVQARATGGTHAGAKLSLRLSWLSKLPNRFRLVGEKGSIAGGMYDTNQLSVTVGGRSEKRKVQGKGSLAGLAHGVIDNFLDVVEGRAAPLVCAADVRASIALIEACYAHRRRFDMPWDQASALRVNDD
jgi:predicted dehydrogenase